MIFGERNFSERGGFMYVLVSEVERTNDLPPHIHEYIFCVPVIVLLYHAVCSSNMC